MLNWYHIPTAVFLIGLLVTQMIPNNANGAAEMLSHIAYDQINVATVEKKGNHANNTENADTISDTLTANDIKDDNDDTSEREDTVLHADRIYDPVDGVYIDLETFNKYSAEGYTHFRGIGKIIAERIFEYRQTQGPFETFEALIHVKGIGDAKIKAILEAAPTL
ncbi:MAG: Helix-hairpin-helix motif [Clostridiales bacterium]|jgi:hypothetical protein|nr:Helix-hairpin-helix motif [Clostridiales bacterium]MDN5298450.1 Helix-hairpin-helix motif [Clostridiales bacterium]